MQWQFLVQNVHSIHTCILLVVPRFYWEVHVRCIFKIMDSLFREVGKNLVVPGGARVIDAQKKLVMPGNETLIQNKY